MNQHAIYIHVPWCRRRCPYCNFYLVVGEPDAQFADALIREWHYRAKLYPDAKASSLYFGGGTPSLLKPQQIANLISFFITQGALDNHAEITLEANPEDLSLDFIAGLKASGVNRISLGVQSFDDQTLRVLGRMHTGKQALESIINLQSAGFNNISVDLIIGVPGEKSQSLLDSLDMLSDHSIGHISTYLLTIEDKTNFQRRIASKKMAAPCEEAQVEIYRLVQAELSARAYEQYDISSFAQRGFFSRHNQVYWATGSYIGLGPGAHSMRMLADGGIERVHNRAQLKSWLVSDPHEGHYEQDHLKNHEALAESLAFGLRNMHSGIDPEALALRHHHPLPLAWPHLIEKFHKSEWLAQEADGRVRISPYGALFADAIMREIVCA